MLLIAVLFSHYDAIEIILYRIGMGVTPGPQYTNLPTTQVDLLFRCLEACKAFFVDFHSFPSSKLLVLPFTVWCQYGQAMMTLSRLIFYDGESIGWDRGYVRSTIDFDSIGDATMKKLDEAQALIFHGLAEPPEIMERLRARMKLMKDMHRKRVEAQTNASLEAPQQPLDFNFVFNLPMDTFFPYGDYGPFPGAMQETQQFY